MRRSDPVALSEIVLINAAVFMDQLLTDLVRVLLALFLLHL